MDLKQPLTYDEQLNKLEAHGMVISDKEKARDILKSNHGKRTYEGNEQNSIITWLIVACILKTFRRKKNTVLKTRCFSGRGTRT